MKRYFTLFAVLIFLNFAQAQKACIDYFNEQNTKETQNKTATILETDIPHNITDIINEYAKTLYEVKSLRDKIDFWKRLTGDSHRFSEHEIKMKKKLFEFMFKNTHDIEGAIDLYKGVFLNVELGWFQLTQYEKDLAQGKKSSTLSKKEILKIKKNFAENIMDYIYIRSSLESLAEGKLTESDLNMIDSIVLTDAVKGMSESDIKIAIKASADNARTALKGLGAPSFVTSASNRIFQQPSVEQLQLFFRDHLDLIILKLKYDHRLQIKYAIKLVPMTLTQVQTIQTLIIKIVPERYRPILADLIGLNYNSYVLERYLPDIETVLDTPNLIPHQRLQVLRALSANKSTVEFLTTFARLTNYTNDWIALRKEAEELKDETLYNRFHEQMLEAEKNALKSTWLTPFYKPSFIDHVRIWIGPSIALLGANHLTSNAISETVTKKVTQAPEMFQLTHIMQLLQDLFVSLQGLF